MDVHLKRKIKRIIAPIRRIGLKNSQFSIISNNCWGGYIYDRYGLKYLSPTIGGVFFPDDYIKFLNKLDYYLSKDIKLISPEESKHYLKIKEKQYKIIGVLDDIEYVFIHYDTPEDALSKWNKRRRRVDFNNLLVKFNDQNGFESYNYEEFVKLNYNNKLFFTSNRNYMTENYCYFISKFETNGYAIDDLGASKGIVNYKKILNSIRR